MSVQPGGCRAGRGAGSGAGRRWAGHRKQRHQAQQHIRAPGGSIWSALDARPGKQGHTTAPVQPCRHALAPG